MPSSAPRLEPPAKSLAALQRHARCCRITSVVILLLGIVSAAIVYWLGSRAQDLPDDPAMLGYDRAAQRQMGLLYGNQGGQLITGLDDWLKQPGSQALLIMVTALIVAGGFYLAARVAQAEAADAETAKAEIRGPKPEL